MSVKATGTAFNPNFALYDGYVDRFKNMDREVRFDIEVVDVITAIALSVLVLGFATALICIDKSLTISKAATHVVSASLLGITVGGFIVVYNLSQNAKKKINDVEYTQKIYAQLCKSFSKLLAKDETRNSLTLYLQKNLTQWEKENTLEKYKYLLSLFCPGPDLTIHGPLIPEILKLRNSLLSTIGKQKLDQFCLLGFSNIKNLTVLDFNCDPIASEKFIDSLPKTLTSLNLNLRGLQPNLEASIAEQTLSGFSYLDHLTFKVSENFDVGSLVSSFTDLYGSIKNLTVEWEASPSRVPTFDSWVHEHQTMTYRANQLTFGAKNL